MRNEAKKDRTNWWCLSSIKHWSSPLLKVTRRLISDHIPTVERVKKKIESRWVSMFITFAMIAHLFLWPFFPTTLVLVITLFLSRKNTEVSKAVYLLSFSIHDSHNEKTKRQINWPLISTRFTIDPESLLSSWSFFWMSVEDFRTHSSISDALSYSPTENRRARVRTATMSFQSGPRHDGWFHLSRVCIRSHLARALSEIVPRCTVECARVPTEEMARRMSPSNGRPVMRAKDHLGTKERSLIDALRRGVFTLFVERSSGKNLLKLTNVVVFSADRREMGLLCQFDDRSSARITTQTAKIVVSTNGGQFYLRKIKMVCRKSVGWELVGVWKSI